MCLPEGQGAFAEDFPLKLADLLAGWAAEGAIAAQGATLPAAPSEQPLWLARALGEATARLRGPEVQPE
eukprot:1144515-Pyramimonas_sp.AAC.1